jgi:hypothetical protein
MSGYKSYFITSIMIINFVYSEIVYIDNVTLCTEKCSLICEWRPLVLNLRSCEY